MPIRFEAVALLLHRDEGGEQVGAGVAAPVGEERAEILRDAAAADAPALDDGVVRREADGVEAADDVGRPVLDLAVIARRDAQHVADHGDGQRVGQLGDDVHLCAPGDAVEEAVDHGLDLSPHALDHAGREGAVDERAQARMVRRIPEQHGARQAAGLRLLAVLGGEDGLEAVPAEAGVAQGRHAVVVAREDPETEGAQVDRIGLAQAPVERVGIGVELGGEGIEELGVRHGRQLTIA